MRNSRRCVQPAESEPDAKSSHAQGNEIAPPDLAPGPIAIRHRVMDGLLREETVSNLGVVWVGRYQPDPYHPQV
jgi:hypothetical protein